jgi:hypothetical protein
LPPAVWNLKLQAKGGNLDSQNKLGMSYLKGEGVPQDFTEAVQWFRRAAEKGHRDAQLNLAERYSLGEGVALDQSKAEAWRHAASNLKTEPPCRIRADLSPEVYFAAKQGDREAQFQLGQAYATGKLMPQDYNQALILESGVNFSGFCKKQPENEIPATFFAAVDEILKYSHPIISRFEPVAQV